ncbi:hypothetical protein ACP4OV_028407 [Aristida adscensionis]
MARVGVFVLVALLGAVAAHAQSSYGGYGSYPPSPPSSPTPPSPPPPTGPPLSLGFYKYSCPQAEQIVTQLVSAAVRSNPGIGAGLVRMAFHDCFVRGCDASVLLDPTPANPQPEKLAPPNFPSLRGFEVIDAAKAALEKACPATVSCADVVQFAARDASKVLSGGKINIPMPGGRRDGRVSLAGDTTDLPPPNFNLQQLVLNFRAKGLNVADLVILSGAHTIGVSHCSSFSDRLSGSDMNATLAASLRQQCRPANASNDPTVVQDVVTPDTMDNQYYKNVLNSNVLFTSDAALASSWPTKAMVQLNSMVPGLWEQKFQSSMVKMSSIQVKTGTNGEIRKNCRVVN